MSKRDYYSILGISKGASPDEIKKAYRKMAMLHHPDKNPGDKGAEEKFKEASEAYATLSDSKLRQTYDQFGHTGSAATNTNQNYYTGPNFEDFDFEAYRGQRAYTTESAYDLFNDLFGDIMGGQAKSRRGPMRSRGADLRYNLSVTFEEAARGCEKQVRFLRDRNGKEDSANLLVSVPAGVTNGQRLKLKGEGDTGTHGGDRGDLYVIVTLAEHPLFRLHESDILMDLPISFVDAITGTEIEVPTLTGKASLRVPQNTHPGQVFRLKGKGFPGISGGSAGDMLLRVIIDVPASLSKDQIESIKKLSGIGESAPLVSAFKEKVKKLFEGRK